jgi:phosphoribosyl 1,2-cyclic phosphate phosphodiesterase
MKLIILGSGGSVSIPRPFCNCKNCEKARREGVPFARTGPAMFISGEENILFDTPEEIRLQIERERISDVEYAFYTHWHQDHTQGMRIFEHMNFSYPEEPKKEPIKVYIPENSYAEFKKNCPLLSFYEEKKYIKIKKIKDRKGIQIAEIKITPLDFKRMDRVRYGYLIEKKGKRVLYAPCSTFGLHLDEYYENLDLLIMEIGWFGKTKEMRKKLPKEHAWHDHISFEENLKVVKKIKPKRTILTHIDGTRHLKVDNDYSFTVEQTKKYSEKLNSKIDIAYDGMEIEV